MSEPVPADFAIDAATAAAAIAEAFGLRAATVSDFGQGWDNQVFRYGSELLFRFPRRRCAVPLLERELLLLPQLAARLRLPVPRPLHRSDGCGAFAQPFYGYRMLAGRSGCQRLLSPAAAKQAASDLAGFLRQLHAIEPSSLALGSSALAPVHDRCDAGRIIAAVRARFAQLRDENGLEAYEVPLQQLIAAAAAFKRRSPPRLIHGDLYHRHLLFDGAQRLCGIIDWGDACCSDPVVDLAALYQALPPPVHRFFWQAYGSHPAAAVRSYARLLGLHSALALLWYGSGRRDQALRESATRSIDWILGPTAPSQRRP